MTQVKLLLGDEAIAEGAMHAGIKGVYAYPGTPSTEITEYIRHSAMSTVSTAPGVRTKRLPWRLRWGCPMPAAGVWYA